MTSKTIATQQAIMVNGKPYVLLPRAQYEELARRAKSAELPPLPAANAEGNYPAVEYARASLARKIIRDRLAAGLTQRGLAKRAGISFEQLCRIESGKHTPSVPTIDKIDRALKHRSKPTAEEREEVKAARKALAEMKRKGKKPLSWDKVKRELGLSKAKEK